MSGYKEKTNKEKEVQLIPDEEKNTKKYDFFLSCIIATMLFNEKTTEEAMQL